MQGELCGSSADCSATVSFCDQYVGCKCDPGLRFAGGASACVDYGGGPSVTPACGAGSSPDAGTTSNVDAGTGNDAARAADRLRQFLNIMMDRLRRVPFWAWALLFSVALCLPRLGGFGFWDPPS